MSKLTAKMTSVLIAAAEKGSGVAKGRDKATVTSLVERGLVIITNTTRDIDSDRDSRALILHYTVTEAGLDKAIELV